MPRLFVEIVRAVKRKENSNVNKSNI